MNNRNKSVIDKNASAAATPIAEDPGHLAQFSSPSPVTEVLVNPVAQASVADNKFMGVATSFKVNPEPVNPKLQDLLMAYNALGYEDVCQDDKQILNKFKQLVQSSQWTQWTEHQKKITKMAYEIIKNQTSRDIYASVGRRRQAVFAALKGYFINKKWQKIVELVNKEIAQLTIALNSISAQGSKFDVTAWANTIDADKYATYLLEYFQYANNKLALLSASINVNNQLIADIECVSAHASENTELEAEVSFANGNAWESKGEGAEAIKQAKVFYQLAMRKGHKDAELKLSYCCYKEAKNIRSMKKLNSLYSLFNGDRIILDAKASDTLFDDACEEACKHFESYAKSGKINVRMVLEIYFADGTENKYTKFIIDPKWYLPLAKENADAKVCVGLSYFWQETIFKDKALTAIKYFKEAIAEGSTYGYLCLGLYNLNCIINNIVARQNLQKAADLGCRYAQYYLAQCYQNGSGGQSDIQQAVYWYKKSASQGYIQAFETLLALNEQSTNLVSAGEARDYANEAASFGSPIGEYYLAKFIEHENIQGAQYLYESAAAGDNYDAFCRLADLYVSGKIDNLNKNKIVFNCYKIAADHKHDHGIAGVAICYKNGIHVASNISEAISWYEKIKDVKRWQVYYQIAKLKLDKAKTIEELHEVAAHLIKAIRQETPAAYDALTELYFDIAEYYATGLMPNADQISPAWQFNETQAIKFYQKSAARGYQEALEKLIILDKAKSTVNVTAKKPSIEVAPQKKATSGKRKKTKEEKSKEMKHNASLLAELKKELEKYQQEIESGAQILARQKQLRQEEKSSSVKYKKHRTRNPRLRLIQQIMARAEEFLWQEDITQAIPLLEQAAKLRYKPRTFKCYLSIWYR